MSRLSPIRKVIEMTAGSAAEAAAGTARDRATPARARVSRRVQIRQRLAALAVAVAVAMVGLVGAAPMASADTSGYGRVTMDQFRNMSYEFGIPSWVTRNITQRNVAKAACSAYLGDRLGLRWFMWWAPEPVCGYVVDRVWQPNKGMAVCGKIPLANVGGTRVWPC